MDHIYSRCVPFIVEPAFFVGLFVFQTASFPNCQFSKLPVFFFEPAFFVGLFAFSLARVLCSKLSVLASLFEE